MDRDGEVDRASPLSLDEPLVLMGTVADRGGLRGGEITTQWEWTCRDGTEGDKRTSADLAASGPDEDGKVPTSLVVNHEVSQADLGIPCANQPSLASLTASVTLVGENWVHQDSSLTHYFRYYPAPDFRFTHDEEQYGIVEQPQAWCGPIKDKCIAIDIATYIAIQNSGWLLFIREASLQPSTPFAGEPFRILYTVYNVGQREAPEFKVTWTLEGQGTRTVGSDIYEGGMAPGSFEFGWVTFAGAVPGAWRLMGQITPWNNGGGSSYDKRIVEFTVDP